jgi:hypothetical protein
MTDDLTRAAKAARAVVTDVPHAPFIYFDNVATWGLLAGLITVTLSAQRALVGTDGAAATDNVAIAYLRCNILAARSLRDALDKALLGAMPVEEGTKGTTRN